MKTLSASLPRLALAGALVVACAAGLSNPARADGGRHWDGPRHGHAGHGKHHRFDRHPHYGRFDGPRYRPVPRYNARHHSGPLVSFVFRSGPVVAAPVLPPPRIVVPVPAPFYGVTELGPAW